MAPTLLEKTLTSRGQPRSPQRERGKKDPGLRLVTCLGNKFICQGRGPNLSKYCRHGRLLPHKPALWATMESSLSISRQRFVKSSTLLSTFETKLGLETMKR